MEAGVIMKSLELKPGCLAEVTTNLSSRCGKSNRGRIVTVIRRPNSTDVAGYYLARVEVCWLVAGSDLYLINADLRLLGTSDEHVFDASVLRPISDPDVDVSETTEKTRELVE
jgi:hypothetical protein